MVVHNSYIVYMGKYQIYIDEYSRVRRRWKEGIATRADQYYNLLVIGLYFNNLPSHSRGSLEALTDEAASMIAADITDIALILMILLYNIEVKR